MNLSYIQRYYQQILFTINGYLIPLLFAVAFAYFVWGVYKYLIIGAASDTEREKGRHFILWSVIGFAVIISVWGLVAIVGNTFGLAPGGSTPPYPTL